jgi:hypothetical protein
VNTRQRLEQAWAEWRNRNTHLTMLTLRAMAETLREQVPQAARLRLDWSDQGSFLSPVALLRADGSVIDLTYLDGEDREDILTEELMPLAGALDTTAGPVWEQYLPEAPQSRRHNEIYLLDVADVLAATEGLDTDEVTFHDATVSWYPKDARPGADPGGMPSDMYVLDALGVSVLVRRRSASTYVHIDTIDTATGQPLSPVLVEVNNGGESEYPVDGLACPTCGSGEWDFYHHDLARCVNGHQLTAATREQP